MRSFSKDTKLYAVTTCAALALVTVIGSGLAYASAKESDGIVISELPNGNYDSSYYEDPVAYGELEQMESIDWETYQADPLEEFTTVSMDSALTTASFVESSTNFHDSHSIDVSISDAEKIMLSEDDAWKLVSDGLYTQYPSGNFLENKDTLMEIQKRNTKTIKVKVWYWEDPSDDTNFNKVTAVKTFAVNSGIASLFEHAFEAIYNDPSQPVINLADGGMGTWVIRGKNHNNYARMSTHSLGCCIDLNPGTGSFYINGKWYGNAYGQRAMSKEIWENLPECHKKYHVLYAGSPIVEIFKSYGFVWGGDWESGTDPMHLSWIGEGSNTRSKGQANYTSRL